MTSKKRTNDGREKPQKNTWKSSAAPSDTAASDNSLPDAHGPNTSRTTSTTQTAKDATPSSKKRKLDKPQELPARPLQLEGATAPAPPQRTQQPKRKKLQKLPDNVSITKRPLHRPAIPTPFSSSASPKVVYLNNTTPFIPTIKRIRRLLEEISKRHTQSISSQPSNRNRKRNRNRRPLAPNGRLAPAEVEQEIAEEAREKTGGSVAGEEVFVKAAGRAIERALKVGLHFQGEKDCKVRIEMGSVMAVDDIEVKERKDEEMVEAGDCLDGDGKAKVLGKAKAEINEEDIPETRVRMLSSITVAISLR